MPTQAVTLRRCASCNRWSGARSVGALPLSVEIDNEQSTGHCVDGPWNNSERRARSACGQWIIWLALDTSAAPG